MIPWEPLGESGLVLVLASEQDAVAWERHLREHLIPGIEDLVIAYARLAILFDPEQLTPQAVLDWLHTLPPPARAEIVPRAAHYEIPVCYEFGQDWDRIQAVTGLGKTDVARLHTTVTFTVHAMGFVPGFPYLGTLPPELWGVPRLPNPRLRVEPGSIGLTGQQTGIYPLPRPGGWNLIGRTPLTIVEVESEFFPLHVGDTIQFFPISRDKFESLLGRRLGHEMA
jgi:inhibitor of KinA